MPIHLDVYCCPAHIHQVGAGSDLEGVPPLVSALVHHSVLLAGPGSSDGADPSRRCQGCSHPPLHPQGQAALSFSEPLRRLSGGVLSSPLGHYGASWRTHGCQYTSVAFGQRCQDAGIERSMGAVGDCFDHAITESFFATLECELLDRHVFRTHDEARTAIFASIEGFYTPHRRHSALDYLSPAAFERRINEERVA